MSHVMSQTTCDYHPTFTGDSARAYNSVKLFDNSILTKKMRRETRLSDQSDKNVLKSLPDKGLGKNIFGNNLTNLPFC
jgi:hypothetical protein